MCQKLLRFVRPLGAALMCMVMVSAASADFTYVEFMDMEFAVVGNTSNTGNMRYTTTQGYGAVGDYYLIAKHPVTAGQYTEFLNAVAKTDPNNLYNSNMWSDTYGCKIQRSGSDGNWTYSVASDYANRPVNFVNIWDAARFANWLHNGKLTGPQGTGTTEAGAYINIGNQATFARTDSAKVFLPTHHEWYKAAFHKNDGDTGNYWDYPTASDTTPSNYLAPPGSDPGNNANFFAADYTIGDPYYRTEVGAFTNSASAYGTFDQGGNVGEWNETAYDTHRGVFGGSFIEGSLAMFAQQVSTRLVTHEGNEVGFRVAASYGYVIPEPGSATLLLLAAIAGLLWRRR